MLFEGLKGCLKGTSMAVYGYQRVSTKEQNLSRQTKQLVDYGIEPSMIYTDKESGGKIHRDGLDNLLSIAKEGDKVVVIALSRLSRSLHQLLSISEDFDKRGIELVSLKENIDTSTASGKLFFGVTAAFAQYERDINNERTKEGLAAAKRKGSKLGRPKVDAGKLDEAMELYSRGALSVKEIAQLKGVSESVIYRAAKKRGLSFGCI